MGRWIYKFKIFSAMVWLCIENNWYFDLPAIHVSCWRWVIKIIIELTKMMAWGGISKSVLYPRVKLEFVFHAGLSFVLRGHFVSYSVTDISGKYLPLFAENPQTATYFKCFRPHILFLNIKMLQFMGMLLPLYKVYYIFIEYHILSFPLQIGTLSLKSEWTRLGWSP